MEKWDQKTDRDTTTKNLIKRMGIFTLAQAEALGIKQPGISRFVKKGLIKRVRRGVYIHPKAQVSANSIEFQIACAKFGPRAAIGGMSALFHYKLVDQVPGQTWIIVSPEVRTRERHYRLMRTKSNLSTGIISNDRYRITSVDRTLVEALKFASKIGERTTLRAIRTAISQKLSTEAKLGKMAKGLGLDLASKTEDVFPNLVTSLLIERFVARLVSEKQLRNSLVFKGGFVGLRVYQSPRFTVDLDALLIRSKVVATTQTLLLGESLNWSVYPIETIIAEKLHAIVVRAEFRQTELPLGQVISHLEALAQ